MGLGRRDVRMAQAAPIRKATPVVATRAPATTARHATTVRRTARVTTSGELPPPPTVRASR